MKRVPHLYAPLVAVLLTVGLAVPARGQTAAADPGDVESLDAIIEALYDVISGPAGEDRDWDRFRSLFAEGARLIPTGRNAEGQVRFQVWSPDEYVERAGSSLMESGFFEREIGRVEERFGNIIHVFSTYDSKRSLDDAEPFARGINSIQVLEGNGRFWVVSIFWDSERPDNLIPNKYKFQHRDRRPNR